CARPGDYYAMDYW
nr:immunoglobulin heavy chain junction region [Mus musculus]